MRLVDSSAWIEFYTASRLGKQITLQLPLKSEWLVPKIVQFELLKWVAREVGEDDADEFLAFSTQCTVVELSTEIAVMAAAMSRRYKLATADAIIYATAQLHKAELLTCDAHFKDLPGVVYLEK